jgi:type IV pilus assembly protein PilC
MNKKEQLTFIHRCAALIESGISLGEALSIIFNMERSKKMRKILGIMRENVEKGVSFSRSIALTKVRLDQTLVAMIKNGEGSGTLALSLRQAYQVMEKSGELKKKMFGALMYPSFIAVATVAMTLFLVMYIFPKIIPLFSSMNIKLPLLTRAVRALYFFFLQYGLWVCGSALVFVVLFQIFYRKNLSFRSLFQKVFLRLPILGESIKKYCISTFLRSMGVLLENGQSLSSILEQTSASLSYEPYRRGWNECYIEVTKGVALSQSMKSFPCLFPDLVPSMLFIGERTGSLSSMLIHVSKMYEQELDNFIKQFSTLIEPILMVGMGLVVGSVALSIILPIYEITNHLTK